jgi:ABC-type polysaccharide/polyol phosphate transport system ATPase subunit
VTFDVADVDTATTAPETPTESRDVITVDNAGIHFAINRRRRLKLRDVFVRGHRALASETFWAVRNVSFTVGHGEAVGLVGRNGSGKSTLLRLVAGVMLPDEGSIHVDGGVGAMLELSAGFNPDLTGRDNVYLLAALHGFSREEIDDIYDEIVEWAELKRFMDTPLRHYSSGMKARLGFSVVTRLDEPILLIDEVLAVGDRSFRRKCAAVMENLLSEGRTVLLVSHNENDLARFCSRGIYLKNGTKVGEGPMREILQQYRADADDEAPPARRGPGRRKRPGR